MMANDFDIQEDVVSRLRRDSDMVDATAMAMQALAHFDERVVVEIPAWRLRGKDESGIIDIIKTNIAPKEFVRIRRRADRLAHGSSDYWGFGPVEQKMYFDVEVRNPAPVALPVEDRPVSRRRCTCRYYWNIPGQAMTACPDCGYAMPVPSGPGSSKEFEVPKPAPVSTDPPPTVIVGKRRIIISE